MPKKDTWARALTCQGEKGVLQALRVGTAFDGYIEKWLGIVPQLPLGKEDLEFVLFCFVFIIKAPHEPQKYRTRTPACKNKDPDGIDESSVCWNRPARIETSSASWERNREMSTLTMDKWSSESNSELSFSSTWEVVFLWTGTWIQREKSPDFPYIYPAVLDTFLILVFPVASLTPNSFTSLQLDLICSCNLTHFWSQMIGSGWGTLSRWGQSESFARILHL